MTLKKLSNGCTRSAYLSDNGVVIKKPNYSRVDYKAKIGPGGSETKVFNELLDKCKEDRNIKKILELESEGRKIYAAARNIVTEYMLSLIMLDEEKKFFANCFDIKIRRSPKTNGISVVGHYENAYDKETIFGDNIGALLLRNRTGIILIDLHDDNLVNNLIVDYAAIYTK